MHALCGSEGGNNPRLPFPWDGETASMASTKYVLSNALHVNKADAWHANLRSSRCRLGGTLDLDGQGPMYVQYIDEKTKELE